MALAAIPSPAGSSFDLGPLELRAYGLTIAVGALVAVWWSQKRWQARGHSPDDISTVALWAIPAGLIGSRTSDGQIIETDTDFVAHLLRAANVAVVPGRPFGLSPFFRLSFTASLEVLEEACGRIASACAELSRQGAKHSET